MTIIILFIAGLGFVKILLDRTNLASKISLTNAYLSKFLKFAQSALPDSESYIWLVQNSQKMQTAMGIYGIMAMYRPAASNQAYSNYPIIINMIPEIRSHFAQIRLTHKPEEHLIVMVRDALVRYLGVLNEENIVIWKSILNPLIWFRIGIQVLLLSPLYLLAWMGITGMTLIRWILRNQLFNIISGLIAFIGLIGSVITIVLGWTPFLQLVQKLIDNLSR